MKIFLFLAFLPMTASAVQVVDIDENDLMEIDYIMPADQNDGVISIYERRLH